MSEAQIKKMKTIGKNTLFVIMAIGMLFLANFLVQLKDAMIHLNLS